MEDGRAKYEKVVGYVWSFVHGGGNKPNPMPDTMRFISCDGGHVKVAYVDGTTEVTDYEYDDVLDDEMYDRKHEDEMSKDGDYGKNEQYIRECWTLKGDITVSKPYMKGNPFVLEFRSDEHKNSGYIAELKRNTNCI